MFDLIYQEIILVGSCFLNFDSIQLGHQQRVRAFIANKCRPRFLNKDRK